VRAHYTRPVTDQQGDLLPSVQVTLYEPGTTSPIVDVVYVDGTSSNVLSNPFVSDTGIINFYLENPKRVDLAIAQGGLPVQTYADVDVIAAGADSLHLGTGLNSMQIGNLATATGNNSIALGPGTTGGGTQSTAVGSNANSLGDQSVAIGPASVQGLAAVGIGNAVSALADNSVAIGAGAATGMSLSTAIGQGATANYANSAALGAGATSNGAHQIMIGTGTEYVELPMGSYLVMTSAGGSRYQITVDDNGSLTTTPI
jgi:hypothetical protein